MDDEELVVARIGKPHGLRGEVTVQLHTDDPRRRLPSGATVATRAGAGSGVPRQLTVRSTRVHRGIWLVAFEEVQDRSGAESLRGTWLVVDPAEHAGEDHRAHSYHEQPGEQHGEQHGEQPGEQRAEDGWYPDELRGLAVVSRDGNRLGQVTGLELGPAQDLLVVALDTGRTAYLPFVEAIVPEVDVEGGRVVVDPPPGLLELNG